jgi:hypothetical protein
MANFTPGPWREEMGDIFADVDGSEYLVAEVDVDCDLREDEIEANCNLIAAAPEMYAALKAIEINHIALGALPIETIALAAAALKKADGTL